MDNQSDLDETAALASPPIRTEAELHLMMEASDADVAAGRTVALAPVLARMQTAAEQSKRARAAPSGSVIQNAR